MPIKKKKILFVFGRTRLNEAKLQFMPFALNCLRKLAENQNNIIDVYLTQNEIKHYKDYFSSNVNFYFLDNKYIWRNGSNIKLYFIFNFYFYLLTIFKKYSEVWGCGQLGIVLAGKFAIRNKLKFICLNDEFPEISFSPIWIKNEKISISSADELIIPDEVRIPVLKKQVAFTSKTRFWVCPNIPFQKDILTIANIDWKSKLSINGNYMVYAGGISEENNIEIMLTSLQFSTSNLYLVIVGNAGKYKNRFLNHPRIIWQTERLDDDELHSLVKQAVCSICYYADFSDLEYVGKSSGKIMRSLLVGTPVITTNFDSLKFIEDDMMGLLVTTPVELVYAIDSIEEKELVFRQNIQKNIDKYKFENYWNNFSSVVLNQV